MYTIQARYDSDTHALFIFSDKSNNGRYDELTICIIKIIVSKGNVKDAIRFIKDPEIKELILQYGDEDLYPTFPKLSSEIKELAYQVIEDNNLYLDEPPKHRHSSKRTRH